MQEEKLIEKCKKGNRKAQKYLYDKYSSVMFGICIRYSKNLNDAEDILQEGFIKIFGYINSYEGKGSFEGWMKRIMVNTAITFYHKNLKHKYHDDISELQETINTDSNWQDSDFTHDELLRIIQTLPDGYRNIFNLYAIEGYKHKEIAQMLEIDVSTSKSQYHRAKKIIRNKLEALKKVAIKI